MESMVQNSLESNFDIFYSILAKVDDHRKQKKVLLLIIE